jgi:hypothetical protein
MRAMTVAGAAFTLAVVFGLGVVVGRFVLGGPQPAVTAPTTALPGLPGFDDPLDRDAILDGDPSLLEPPPVPPTALPPATGPGGSGQFADATAAARAESAAAMQAAPCTVRVSKQMPVRAWAEPGTVVAEASGDTCGSAVVRLSVRGRDGAVLYTLTAPASDFGIPSEGDPGQLRGALDAALPNSAVRAAAYPPWGEGAPAPPGAEFDRTTYEAIRAADVPVVCIRVPTAPERCVAADPASGQVRVLSRN